MAIPKYHEIMLPLLKHVSDGKVYLFPDVVDAMAEHYKISEDERKILIPSGTRMFDGRVGWASTYLKKAKLIDKPERGTIVITERGQSVLKENLQAITPRYLKKFEEFIEFQNIGKTRQENEKEDTEQDNFEESTPQEQLENAHKALTNGLVSDILIQIEKCSPFFFERLVVDLLINMGYGGSRKEAGEAFQTSGDGGIDGTIKEDRLGLDVIYIQAKRWNRETVVGRPEIQKFVGALQGVRAKKGIFITTTRFSKDAREYVNQIDTKIILIDGTQLAEFMIDSDTGVSTVASYKIKKLDLDYFQE